MTRKTATIAVACMLMLALFASCGKEAATTENKAEAAPAAAQAKAEPEKIITIDTLTIDGEAIDNSFYEGCDVILVNMMSTTCPPCVKEIPELQEIHEEDNGIGVLGIVADTIDRKTGDIQDSYVADAKVIRDSTGAAYPFTIPSLDMITVTMGKLAPVFPMSFIVDSNGKVIKGPIAGARSKAEWMELIAEARKTAGI